MARSREIQPVHPYVPVLVLLACYCTVGVGIYYISDQIIELVLPVANWMLGLICPEQFTVHSQLVVDKIQVQIFAGQATVAAKSVTFKYHSFFVPAVLSLPLILAWRYRTFTERIASVAIACFALLFFLNMDLFIASASTFNMDTFIAAIQATTNDSTGDLYARVSHVTDWYWNTVRHYGFHQAWALLLAALIIGRSVAFNPHELKNRILYGPPRQPVRASASRTRSRSKSSRKKRPATRWRR